MLVNKDEIQGGRCFFECLNINLPISYWYNSLIFNISDSW